MRFVFVDRIVELHSGRRIEVLKNVSATEDVFDDHFPGCPIFPGALIIEVFDQATQLLVGMTHDWTHLGWLQQVMRASFRRFVRPGDQLVAVCERRDPDEAASVDGQWRIAAAARVDGRTVATAMLTFGLEVVGSEDEARRRAQHLRGMADVLRANPLEMAGYALE